MGLWRCLKERRRRDGELEEELRAHFEMAARDRAVDGGTAAEVAASVRREFGNVGLVKEVTREMWGWMSLERLGQDLRYAGRVLRRSPGFAAAAVLSMALGIGANTAIFSLVQALLLRSLPVENPSALMTVGDAGRPGGVSIGSARTDLFSYEFYQRFREENSVFSDVYASGRSEVLKVLVGGAAEAASTDRVRGRFVTGNFFSVLGVHALLGRTFTEGEVGSEGSAPVVVISFGYWERQFARNPGVIGRAVKINGSTFTIIGVTPKQFFGDVVGVPYDLWLPITMQAAANPGRNYLRDRKVSWLLLMGRLKPGVSERQAAAGVNVTAKQVLREVYSADETPEELQKLLRDQIQVLPGAKGFSRLRQEARMPLLILLGTTGLILLLCCSNVANLQLARALSRGRELGLRLAVGAGQFRLIRQLLTESLALAMLGATVGLVFAVWGSHMLLRLITPEGPLPLPTDLNATVLLFTAALAIFSGLLFGLAPALRATRFDLVSSLKESRSGQPVDSFSRVFGRMLVFAQVVLSVVLLVFAGLFLGTLRNLRSIDVGYARHGLLLAQVDPETGGYKDGQVNQMSRELVARLEQIPGVESVTLSENGLFSGTSSESTAAVEGYVARTDAEKLNEYDQVGPHYFETVGTRVVAGRGIEAQDDERSQKVAVINEKMARFYFPHGGAIGRHLIEEAGKQRVPITIVGVVADAKESEVRAPSPRRFYRAFWQRTEPVSFVNIEIRTSNGSEAVAAEVRRTVARFNPNLPVLSLESAEKLIDDELDSERLVAQMSSFFGVLALLLAAVGLYGVMAYMTARRTVEIGIRLALGAERSAVVTMVMRETWRLLAVGILVGIAASTVMARACEKSLFGMSAFNPGAISCAVAVISAAALIAAFVPARRASRIDPVIALRYE